MGRKRRVSKRVTTNSIMLIFQSIQLIKMQKSEQRAQINSGMDIKNMQALILKAE